MTTPGVQAPDLPVTAATCDPQAAISIRGLSHTYPPHRRQRCRRQHNDQPDSGAAATHRPALDDVALDVRPGEIFGILGPNGSGKTTLFRILATLLCPTTGSVRVFGNDLVSQPHSVRCLLGVMFQMPSLDVKLTAEENLLHQGHLYNMKGRPLRSRINELLVELGLGDRGGEFVGRFSGGMRRRVEMAKALLHRPSLLLLDEPSTGLDPGARRDMWNILSRLRDGHGVTVALTTHLMEEADRCDRVAVMCEGRVVALDTPDSLKAGIGGDVITIEPDPTCDIDELCRKLADRFAPWPEGAEPIVLDGRIHLKKEDGAALVAPLAGALSGSASRVTVGHPTLEDVFLHLTGHTLWE